MGQRLDWLQQAIGYQEDTGKTFIQYYNTFDDFV